MPRAPGGYKPDGTAATKANEEEERELARITERIAETSDKFDVLATIAGGGIAGQAGALRLGIARALVEYNVELRQRLKKAGFLTRDARIKERKKYGQKGARKRFQFSKR